MTIVVAGGSGFLGAALVTQLVSEGHTVVVLSRGASQMDAGSGEPPPSGRSPRRLAWVPDGTIGSWASAVDGADAVINLAGESIGGRRWTAAQKARMLNSRLGATRSLVAAVRAAARPPHLFVSASAVGYYGSRGDDPLTEESAPGTDFLAGVCVAWEREALQAAAMVPRVVVLRSGIVLAADGGALAQMLTPFKLYAGGPLGSGRQFVSWIHREDWLRLARWVLATDGVSGPVNATAPDPVTNAAFARALGRVLHKPSRIPAPAVALRLALGEMADGLLLSSQRVLPAKATALGFTFRFRDLEDALRDILANRSET